VSVDVSFTTLESISRTLHNAAMDLNDVGSSTPRDLDAGDMTAAVSAMISKLSESAAGLCEGTELASSEVLNSKSTYWNADDSTATGFTNPQAR
jgi:hypothetical protein